MLSIIISLIILILSVNQNDINLNEQIRYFYIVFCCRQKQQEIVNLEAQIHTKIETQRKAGIELDSTCQICLRTKFADGIGHICNYCNVRCCAKCGGKVALRSNKVCKIDSLTFDTRFVHVEVTEYF